jgi:pimeloyl-ACP methyl ester carboxylesterase
VDGERHTFTGSESPAWFRPGDCRSGEGEIMDEQDSDRVQERLSQSLTRRSALGKAAGAGAMAALATAGFQAAAQGAPSHASNSIQKGHVMAQSTPVASPAGGAPTVVLVHGSFADASGWAGVIDRLRADGTAVLAPANPQRGVSLDAAYIASVVNNIPGPVLLVGHSYGGFVITNAATQTPNVVGLVYVAGFAPDEGESVLSLSQSGPPTKLGPALRSAQVANGPAGETGVEFIIDPAQFHEAFCADLPEELAATMAVSQRPAAEAGFGEPSGPPAWKTLPSWAVIATEDVTIGADGLRFFAQRAGSTAVEVQASHVVMISQPDAVTDVIRTALASVS